MLTDNEIAFVAHMRKVCPSLEEMEPRSICTAFYEALIDWTAAVRWGQMNPELVP